ncbi:MAG TPA: inositol monophosphatase family protein [Vicinamibacterales bacterium]|nr:inositol monophosphatase family protein [Vicinamibacterales bacterium]
MNFPFVSQPDPRFLATAIEAVVRAGDIQIARFGSVLRIEKKGAIDLVTDIDVEVEEMFRALVQERFPDHDVLAEERGQSRTGARHRWVFDPLDGTTNYAHGIPLFCSTLALEIDGVPTVAAVYDPNRRELFTAEAGVGAWLNGEPLDVSATRTLNDSVLVTGFPYDIREPARMHDIIALFTEFLGHARAVRRLGSAAIDLCWVAAGRMDGFWEQALQPWDVMGGALIVQEAGGRVTGLDGSPWNAHRGHVLASNGHVHDEMLAVIRK